MADISLSKAVRSNLLSLQNTASMMAKTQERLATGNKVNSALDNPTNFFTAAGLNARAGDLNQLMDSMANGIQTLEAADNGLTAITKTLESMQSTLRQARQDKSFLTESYEVGGGTGDISFSGGAIGASARTVALQNTALTTGALGLTLGTAAGTPGADEIAGDPVVAPTPSTHTGAIADPGTFALSGDSTLEIALGTEPAIQVDLVEDATLQDIADAINLEAGEDIADLDDDGQLRLTNAAGTGITVTAGAVATEIFGTADVVPGDPGDAGTPDTPAVAATATFDWGGDALEMNNDAKISFTATINGVEKTIEITRKDVLKAGNGDGTIDSAEEFAAILTSKVDGATFAAGSNGTITMTADTAGANVDFGLSDVSVTGTNYDADELVRAINSDDDLKGLIRASNDNGKLRIENQSTQELNVDGVNSSGTIDGTSSDVAKIGGNTVRADLKEQYNELRDQLDKLADDASFNGINLLRGDKLTLTFNETGTSSIDIQTKNAEQINASNLDIFNIEAEDLDSDANIDKLLADLKTALNDVRSQSSAFGSNLSIVQNRQDFTKNMVNTLETGGANLTLADMNEEAANLLALQTRQSLSSNSLSLASQADQSVLQLIR